MNIAVNVKEFDKGFNAEHRDASFDYCFNYFQEFYEDKRIEKLAEPEHIEKSCLHLGFFLASWGMYRGNTELFEHSSRFLRPIIETISRSEPLVWSIDVNQYDEANVRALTNLAELLRECTTRMTGTLVTKIMLGVFGNMPAFDSVFKLGWSRTFPDQKRKVQSAEKQFEGPLLIDIARFYSEHADEIDRERRPTLDFLTGEQTGRLYPRAKVIDMIFFQEGSRQQ